MDYRFLENMSKISPSILLVPSFLLCPQFLYYSGYQLQKHISLDIKILRNYKSMHGENLESDIGLGNHFNPRQSSKCTIFMTGFVTKVLYFIYRGKC